MTIPLSLHTKTKGVVRKAKIKNICIQFVIFPIFQYKIEIFSDGTPRAWGIICRIYLEKGLKGLLEPRGI